MDSLINLITGDCHEDHRGSICFVNDFDMSEVKRLYIINHPNTKIIRGWRAHKIEQRWFVAISGEFLIRLIKIDDWLVPTKDLPVLNHTLSASEMQVLHIPSGYGSSIQALKENSKLLVFGDYHLSSAIDDDYSYPIDYFNV